MFYKEIIARGVSYDRVMASESVRADEGLMGCEEREARWEVEQKEGEEGNIV